MSNFRKAAQPELPRRFYEKAAAAETADGYAVLLDGRGLRTPARRSLVLPDRRAAAAVVAEWNGQGERIDPATMPVTRLANTVIDGIADDPTVVRDDLARFAETDLLFYRAGAPDRLVERQCRIWDPILRHAEERLGARFVLAEGVMHVAQPPTTLEAVRRRLARETEAFRVAALHQMTTLTGSVLLTLALADGSLDLDAAWDAAHVDEDWNREQWGVDDEAEARRAARYADMRAAASIVEGRSDPEG